MTKISVTGVTGNLGGMVFKIMQRKWHKSEKFG